METPLLTWLCANQASGGNDSAALDELKQALERASCAPARIIDIAATDVPTREELEQAGVGRLAVFTGDGTINAVATACEGWAGELLILPGGTANLLSHVLHGDQEACDIVAALPRANVVRRPCIRNGPRTALAEVLAGPGAAWSDVREEMREGNLGGVAATSLTAIRESTLGSMVALALPQVGREEGYAGLRLEPLGNGIAVEGYGAETVGDYFKQGMALLRREFREGPHEELALVPEVVCFSLESEPVELMIDGERHSGSAEERFVLDQLDLNFLSTRDSV
jgi:hypothetical protein